MFLPACENCLTPSRELFCGPCRELLEFKNVCISCGHYSLVGLTQCIGCRNKSWAWDDLYSSFFFTEGVCRWMSDIKEGGRPERWRELRKDWIPKFSQLPEAIVFVPADPSSFRRRLYDPGEALAEHLARRLRLPVLNIFRREIFLSSQKQLSRQDRLQYFRETLKLQPLTQRFTCLLLVDDVMTTGASLTHCSELLRAVSERVVVYSVARTLATKPLI